MCQFPLFETIAVIAGEPQHLRYHQARVDGAMRDYFQVHTTLSLAEILQVPTAFQQGVVRCRIDYSATDFQLHFSAYTPRRITRFYAVNAQNLDYQFKYTDRKRLNLRENLQKNEEVLIINNGWVSDCTIGNLLFFKQGQWFSPQDYLLKGTQLTYLLDNGVVKLAKISAKELNQYEQVMMVNALNPFDIQRALPISAIIFVSEIEKL